MEPEDQRLIYLQSENSGLTNDYIRCITEQDQKLIIGTFDGLSILDLRNDDISKYNRFDANQNSLSHFSVRSIYIDREKTLWVGTYSGGVNYYNPLNNRFIFYHPVENNNQKLYNIFGTMVYDSTSLWIATEGGGLMQFNPITKEYTNFLIEQTSKDCSTRTSSNPFYWTETISGVAQVPEESINSIFLPKNSH